MSMSVYVDTADFDRKWETALVKARAYADRKADEVKKIVQEGAAEGHRTMLAMIPRQRGNPRYSDRLPDGSRTLSESLEIGVQATASRATDFYRPGGAGGGGVFAVEIGFVDPPKHLEWVWNGSKGALSGFNGTGQNKVMKFNTSPATFRDKVEGQEPQRDWFTIGSANAHRHVHEALMARFGAL